MNKILLLEDFVKDPHRVDAFTQAVAQLKSIGAEGVLLEIAAEYMAPAAAQNAIEYGAMTSAWRDGYYTCLKEIFLFRERNVETLNEEKSQAVNVPTFHDYENDYLIGDITEKEYERTTGRKPPKRSEPPTIR